MGAVAIALTACARESPVDGEVTRWKEFEIITCRGVNQAAVPCPVGEPWRFRGALVCKLNGPWLDRPPSELCAHLPYGCEPFVLNDQPATSERQQAGPRCSASDSDCGPQRYGGDCLEGGGYVWGAERKPVFPFPVGGSCEADGDCSINLAERTCRACDSRFDRVRRLGCKVPRGAEWGHTFCGCVEGRCDFFRQ